MKITPLPSTGVPTFGGAAEASRSMTVRTNATPGQDSQNVGQPPLEEEESKSATEATEPISPQLALLAKKRRDLQREIKAFEERKSKEQSTTQADVIPKDQLKSNWLPILLNEAGLSWEDLIKSVTEYQASGSSSAELQAMRNELKQLREGQDKRWTDYETQQETQARAEMRREAENLVQSTDEFEALKLYGKQGIAHVDDLIYRAYKDGKGLMSVREACHEVEQALVQRSLKYAQLKKVQSQLAPPPPEQAPQPAQPMQRQMRTITNRHTASMPLSPKQRALAAFNGTLKR